MKSSAILGLMSLFLISACGKNMNLTTRGDSIRGTPGRQVEENSLGQASVIAKQGELGRSTYDGELLPLPPFDLNQIQDQLPFEGSSDRLTNLGQYTTAIERNGIHGVVTHSNLVFRAIKNLAPLDAIEHVDAIDLHLKGVRLVLNSTKDEELLDKQVLCILDTKQCVGSPEMNSKDGKDILSLNPASERGGAAKPKFWDETRFVATSEHPFEEIGGFKSELDLENGLRSFIYTSGVNSAEQNAPVLPRAKIAFNPQAGSGELVIHLKELYNLHTDADAKAWLYANSTEFSGNYRKFKFVMGNNIAFESGELEVTTRLSKSMPPEFAQLPAAAKNGEQDLPQVLPAKNPEILKAKSGAGDQTQNSSAPAPVMVSAEAAQKFSSAFFEKEKTSLSADSLEKIQLFVPYLLDHAEEISQIEVSAQSPKTDLSDQKAKSLIDALIASGFPKEKIKMNASLTSEEEAVFMVTILSAPRTTDEDQALLNAKAKDFETKLQELFGARP